MTKEPYDRYDYRTFWTKRNYENFADTLAISKILKSLDCPRRHLLDLGGGYGRNIPICAPFCQKMTLLDPSSHNIENAKKFLGSRKNVELVIGKGEALPFEDGSFDTILSIRVSHHFSDLKPLLAECYRVLEPGGVFIFEVANKLHFKSRVGAFLRGRSKELHSLENIDRRSEENRHGSTIDFVNHHPAKVVQLLTETGFIVKIDRSVSNFRSPLANKPVFRQIFSALEPLLQRLLANSWFGPSLYLVAIKKK